MDRSQWMLTKSKRCKVALNFLGRVGWWHSIYNHGDWREGLSFAAFLKPRASGDKKPLIAFRKLLYLTVCHVMLLYYTMLCYAILWNHPMINTSTLSMPFHCPSRAARKERLFPLDTYLVPACFSKPWKINPRRATTVVFHIEWRSTTIG